MQTPSASSMMKMDGHMKQFKNRIMLRGAALLAVFLVIAGVAGDQLLGFSVVKPGPVSAAIATLAVGYLLADKSTFLPFLGETVLPPSVLRIATPTEGTLTATVRAPRRATHCVYWASSGANTDSPRDAYQGYKNAGVVEVLDRKAVLPLLCPSIYKVRGRALPKHVHYRFVYPEGVFSKVHTQPVVC